MVVELDVVEIVDEVEANAEVKMVVVSEIVVERVDVVVMTVYVVVSRADTVVDIGAKFVFAVAVNEELFVAVAPTEVELVAEVD